VRGDSGFQLKGYDLLRIATVGGAECLGLANDIGTLEVGKLADLVVLNFRGAQLVPNTNYHETIAYRAKSRDITHTIINGRIVYQDGKLQLTDQDAIFDEGKRLAREWVRRNRPILDRAGVTSRIQPHFFDGERLDQAVGEKQLLKLHD
jgi:cytosine/adenosine deaminase-related metal-dependent hydrolase